MKSAAFILLGLVATTAAAQSLGEIAEQEKARRAALKTQSVQPSGKTVRVYTQNDIKTAMAADDTGIVEGEATKDSAVATAPRSVPAATAAPDPQEAQKQAWRTKSDAVRIELAAAERDVKAMEALGPGLTIEPNGLIQARARLTSARQRLDQLEDDARRQGIPPGWMR
jgi:hypothetical protein